MKVGEFLDKLISMSSTRIPTRCDPSRLRPADVTLQVPCVDKFIKESNWQPEYSFEESLEHLLNYWREKADEEVRSSTRV